MSNTQTTAHPGKSKLWRPPIVGIITFVLMFFAIGLAHTMMVLIEHQLGQELTLKLSKVREEDLGPECFNHPLEPRSTLGHHLSCQVIGPHDRNPGLGPDSGREGFP